MDSQLLCAQKLCSVCGRLIYGYQSGCRRFHWCCWIKISDVTIQNSTVKFLIKSPLLNVFRSGIQIFLYDIFPRSYYLPVSFGIFLSIVQLAVDWQTVRCEIWLFVSTRGWSQGFVIEIDRFNFKKNYLYCLILHIYNHIAKSPSYTPSTGWLFFAKQDLHNGYQELEDLHELPRENYWL